ncbi:Calcineurin-like phosphoesterase [Arsukibacterium tuosuense]|uniref:Calcineurin-like phosphoesterase n=1 Tax=Arsukibacterium tuosuense TaxID=1323745 RepID=A0A285JG81_9GAMM|nr:metallophosphoesterase [Arsukibacterium tuosuense]SNY58396.1 Calcineurin-like phosphoesterase [Arsukibacterium tuosuense]
MYDIIGDIHGHADELELLLAKLDYQRIDGVWQHAERTLISVGDLIDRGPQQKRTVDILKSMAEHGAAHVIQGNHEFNAVAFATVDEQGEPLRPHTKKNQEQHQKFLLVAQSDPAWYQQTIEWFKSLPILLELADFRVVHACWHPESIAVLKQYANDNFVLHEDAWIAANQDGHPLYTALEVLMKGWEIQLPDGCSFLDFANHPRNKIRTRWWLQHAADYQQFAISVPDITMLPKKQVDNKLMVGYDNNKPLFIGHYWLEGIPCCLSEHIACLDWSVTERGL